MKKGVRKRSGFFDSQKIFISVTGLTAICHVFLFLVCWVGFLVSHPPNLNKIFQ
jgi:hypothetical protein